MTGSHFRQANFRQAKRAEERETEELGQERGYNYSRKDIYCCSQLHASHVEGSRPMKRKNASNFNYSYIIAVKHRSCDISCNCFLLIVEIVTFLEWVKGLRSAF